RVRSHAPGHRGVARASRQSARQRRGARHDHRHGRRRDRYGNERSTRARARRALRAGHVVVDAGQAVVGDGCRQPLARRRHPRSCRGPIRIGDHLRSGRRRHDDLGAAASHRAWPLDARARGGAVGQSQGGVTARRSEWTGAPSFADVLAARDFLRAYLAPTPLIRRDAVSSALGLDVWLKCESLLPTAAFKVRGGLNLIGRDPTAKAGVMGASTGNHGQSLAYAGGVFGVPVTIFVPKGANPLKVAAMRVSGATIVEHGDDYDDAREECERRAAATGTRYVHSGNEPYLIAGVATAALAVLLDDFVLVSDDELYAAMRLLLIEGHLVTEGAGAAAVAAARRLAERLAGKRVACWVSGANATADSLRHAMDQR